jgi:two-component system, chemotaxis family, CheB/CheR fusion protein
MGSVDNDPLKAESVTPSVSTDDLATPADRAARPRLPFPVVGIGASAGGVEALQRFFAAVPAGSGMAYVAIQHLSPEHKSLMVDILSRCTSMPVHQIEDGMSIAPDHVYVIRPGRTVTLEDGKLRLGEVLERVGHRRPVDDFFRSLAREQREQAIAVVLSGTGSNGTAGAQTIKAAGGLCIAQDPESADFPGMPQSLIHSGYADQILRTEEIPRVLQHYSQHALGAPESASALTRQVPKPSQLEQQLREILQILHARTGHDFSSYKAATVLRRVQRRMGLVGASDFESYGTRLRGSTAEVTALANDLMINVTGFFRDPEVWEALRESVIRPLIARRQSGEAIRAWVTACASGEEAYSLAILIDEEAERAGKIFEVKIFATDSAEKSLARARAGIYPSGIEGDLPAERLERFFEANEHTYRIGRKLREQIVFAPQDLLRDPPFSRVDIVTCRNLLIYLNPEAQQRTLALLHFALREGGYLLLGNAESLGHADTLFEVVGKRWRIYRRASPAAARVELPAAPPRIPEVHARVNPIPHPKVRAAAIPAIQRALLDEIGAPTAVVDANERIVYFHGDASGILQPPSGEITQNLLEMVRPALTAGVRSALRQAMAEKRLASAHAEAEEPGAFAFAILAAPLNYGLGPAHFRVSFVPLPAGTHSDPSPGRAAAGRPKRTRAEDPQLQQEVRHLRRELQDNIEAFEATTEELKAANEEVTSINEELQSTNEELETTQEELQSVNEELVTVNTQLQGKVLELEGLNDDLDNLLSNTHIAVVFLDTELKVRRFTPAIDDLLGLIAADIGRPVAHLAQKFSGDELTVDAGKVLAKLVPLESEVRSHSGRWYLRRTLPYRTEDDRIAGVVVTFVDISARKQAEQSIEAERMQLHAVIEQLPAAMLLVEAPSGKLLYGNRRAAALFNQPYPLPFVGCDWAAVYSAFCASHGDRRPFAPQEWPLARALAAGEVVLDEELEFARGDGVRATLSMSAAPVRNLGGETFAVVAAFWDITDRKVVDERLQEALLAAQQLRAAAERANRAKDEFISTVSHELRTPLNTIRLWSRMFLNGQISERDVIKGGGMIDRAALAQQQLIDDLLDVSRMAVGQLRLDLREAPLLPALQSAIDIVRPIAASRQIALATDLDARIGIVRADPDRIQQILWNLLSNAVKFTPDGGRIEVRARREDGTVEIEVSDSGCGIRADFLPQVFERFRQGEHGAARRYGGLGLGLSIAKQLAELHGGTISAHSGGEGQGARFRVLLPLESRAPGSRGEGPAADAVAAPETLAQLEVLVVEDDPASRETTSRLLEQHGAAVRQASSAAEARAAFAARRPDVIVADIGMPEEDGYALLRGLRASEQVQHTRRVPAIAVTAFARSEDRERAIASGFDEYLPKPVDPQRLLSLIAQLAVKRAQTRES